MIRIGPVWGSAVMDGKISMEEADQHKVSKSAWRKQKGGMSKQEALMQEKIMNGEFDPEAGDHNEMAEVAGGMDADAAAMAAIMDGEMPK